METEAVSLSVLVLLIPAHWFWWRPSSLSEQVGLQAEPVEALPHVADQLRHAALLVEWLQGRVQLLEELWRGTTGSEGQQEVRDRRNEGQQEVRDNKK